VVTGDDDAQLEAFRVARDELKNRIAQFISDETDSTESVPGAVATG
jgi:hypothetical protein